MKWPRKRFSKWKINVAAGCPSLLNIIIGVSVSISTLCTSMAQTSISLRRLKEIRSLTRRKYRDLHGEMLVEGWRAVEAAVQAKAAIREVLVTPALQGRLPEWVSQAGLDVHVVPQSELEEISAVETSQGIVAVVAIEQASPEALHAARRIVAIDGLQDPGNAGTIIRTAAWFGVDALLTGPGTVDIYNPKVVRAAMGGLWDVDHVEVNDLAGMLQKLRAAGFTIYAADLEGTSIESWRPASPSVLVVGSEAHGISQGVGASVDERVVIPGRPRRGGTESLNAAVAAGIVLYAWTR